MSHLLDEEHWAEFLDFAHKLADAAAVETLKLFRTPIDVEDKGEDEFDPVTVADRAAEKVMRDMIEAAYPDHAILGEEYGREPGDSRYEWVLDPIDGTRAYISGLPTWGTLIALLEDGEPVLGIIDQPFLKERFAGWNVAAEMNGTRIHTRRCKSLSRATLSATGTSWFADDEKAAFARLESQCQLTRYGYDCYAYAMVAHGFMDIAAEAGLKVVDIMALIPVIRGAGGAVAGWRSDEAGENGRLLAVGDADLIGPAQAAFAL